MKLIDKIFRDKNGKIVIAEPPNLPVYGFLIFLVLALINPFEVLDNFLIMVSLIFLLYWAAFELFYGVNYFRRFLGIGGIIIVFTAVIQLF